MEASEDEDASSVDEENSLITDQDEDDGESEINDLIFDSEGSVTSDESENVGVFDDEALIEFIKKD